MANSPLPTSSWGLNFRIFYESVITIVYDVCFGIFSLFRILVYDVCFGNLDYQSLIGRQDFLLPKL